MARHKGLRLRWHNWWAAPRTMAFVRETDPTASHASWMENFACTRLAGVAMPSEGKALVDYGRMALMDPREKREYLGDGCYGGRYEMPGEVTDRLWGIAVEETREVLGRW